MYLGAGTSVTNSKICLAFSFMYKPVVKLIKKSIKNQLLNLLPKNDTLECKNTLMVLEDRFS